jgi:hypothetical protein
MTAPKEICFVNGFIFSLPLFFEAGNDFLHPARGVLAQTRTAEVNS